MLEILLGAFLFTLSLVLLGLFALIVRDLWT